MFNDNVTNVWKLTYLICGLFMFYSLIGKSQRMKNNCNNTHNYQNY